MSSWIIGDISKADELYPDVHSDFLRYEDVDSLPAEDITRKPPRKSPSIK
jgi:hypothetical protein